MDDNKINIFIATYSKKYNLPIKPETIFKKLNAAQLFRKNSFGTYEFKFPYIYYYFIAKYFAEHFEDNKQIISIMI
jgi:hypothetical protein